MKNSVLLLILSFLIFAMSCEKTMTAEMIIENSLEKAHGGKENWEKLNYIFYEKIITLYDSLGVIESRKTQHIQTLLKPDFYSEMFSNDGSVRKHVILKDEQLILYINDEPQVDSEKIEKAYKEMMAAHFVLWQPYKLLTDDVDLTLEGKVHLEDNSEAYKIKAVYPNSENIWWYYFDVETYLLKENIVKHGATYSQIKNIEHEDHTGFRMHQKRESYTIDSIHNQKYLRASYQYNITELRE